MSFSTETAALLSDSQNPQRDLEEVSIELAVNHLQSLNNLDNSDKNVCCVCLHEEATHCLYGCDCKKTKDIVCLNCAENIDAYNKQCPICRQIFDYYDLPDRETMYSKESKEWKHETNCRLEIALCYRNSNTIIDYILMGGDISFNKFYGLKHMVTRTSGYKLFDLILNHSEERFGRKINIPQKIINECCWIAIFSRSNTRTKLIDTLLPHINTEDKKYLPQWVGPTSYSNIIRLGCDIAFH
tara:strand:- start:56 stop:781 length:726 start_codon:yes stop_codon:yes gene_type:complete